MLGELVVDSFNLLNDLFFGRKKGVRNFLTPFFPFTYVYFFLIKVDPVVFNFCIVPDGPLQLSSYFGI